MLTFYPLLKVSLIRMLYKSGTFGEGYRVCQSQGSQSPPELAVWFRVLRILSRKHFLWDFPPMFSKLLENSNSYHKWFTFISSSFKNGLNEPWIIYGSWVIVTFSVKNTGTSGCKQYGTKMGKNGRKGAAEIRNPHFFVFFQYKI